MPSNVRTCPHCKAKMPCGIQKCKKCGKLLAFKERHTKNLVRFRAGAAQWAKKTKLAGNGAKIVDRALEMVEKMKALGHVPILLWGKPRKGKSVGWNADMHFPFELPPEGEVVLRKIMVLFDGLLQACHFTQDMGEGDESERVEEREMGAGDAEGGEVEENVGEDEDGQVGDVEGGEMDEAGEEDREEDGEEGGNESRKEQEEMVEAEEVETKKKGGEMEEDMGGDKGGEMGEAGEESRKEQAQMVEDAEMEPPKKRKKKKKEEEPTTSTPLVVTILAKRSEGSEENGDDDCDFHNNPEEAYNILSVEPKSRTRKGKKQSRVHWAPCPKCNKTFPPSWILTKDVLLKPNI